MSIRVNFQLVIVSVVCFGVCSVCGDDIEVDLANYHPANKNTYRMYTNVSEDLMKIKIKNINDDVGFFILQIHSYIENLTLSYNSTFGPSSFVTGTNIGLIYGDSKSSAKFYLFRNIKYYSNASVLIVVSIYDALDPVPGGCNLSFANMVAPYQIVSYTDDYIAIDSQPPSAYGISCDNNTIQVEMYHLFLNENDNNINTYFEGIDKMLTVDNIRSYGRKVPSNSENFFYHRLFSSYRGTGEVFAIVSTYNNRSSAYVPAVSYGCDLVNWDISCIGPVTGFWKFVCALLLIFGLITCFYGHVFFKVTLFTMGLSFGVLITYFAITMDGHFAVEEKMVTSLIIGFFYGIIWIFIWWKFGVPVLSVHLNFILTGFLLASVIFYAGLADVYIYHSNLNFWVTFLCIMLACIIISAAVTMYGHIFGCSLLGSYAFFTALNYYLGGNLQYIIINTYRRATVKYFNNAVISPPFQVTDIVHSIAWIVIVVLGFYVQVRDQRGKPPFPPNRNGIILANTESERTPLIQPEGAAAPNYVY
ncbi:hypothetical protein NQ315_013309 [Exocentrus adspersus]|uniref:TM7S3/TM198-like domain-containing protein n=1 Tax=Exocentrus adspersus TaxID=1586481 RepID=A0AAV8VGK3_9CUCU|nr:hypothetical protein NQ315_013309 [Exocentrus adspersus]